MLSLLIVGSIVEDRCQQALNLQTKSPYLLDGREEAIAIEDVRDFQKSLSFTNTNSDPRFAFILEAQSLSLPAQQALLKMLEEPPANTQFVLTAPKSSDLLATITSRCQIQRLTKAEQTKDFTDTKRLLQQITQSNHSQLITLAESLTKTPQELKLLLELFSRSLHSSPSTKRSKAASIVSQCVSELNSNIQSQLCIEHMLFSLKSLI
jgi:DNA polymerase III delta prime subunit